MIRLHLFDLDAPAGPGSDVREVLSADEQARADRFRRPRDRDRFAAGRVLVRTLLGEALAIAPADVQLDYGPHGKPRLAGGGPASPTFGVTHSDNLLAVALRPGGGRAVGVDTEFVRPIESAEGVSRRVFTPGETDVVVSAANDGDWSIFHHLWTAKEAVLKALGTGFSLDPRALRIRRGDGDVFSVEPTSDPIRDLPELGLWVHVTVPRPTGPDAAAIVALAPVDLREPLEIRPAPPLQVDRSGRTGA